MQPLQRVDEQESEDAEREDTTRVMGPALFHVLPDAAQLVDQALNGPDHGMQKRALALKHFGHEQPERLRDQEDHAEENGDLEDSQACHRALRTSPGEAAPKSDTPTEPLR